MNRRFLRRVARGVAGAVLLAQLAVSAHACPGFASSGASMTMPAVASTDADTGKALAAAPVRQTVDCEDMMGTMDPSFANLCAAHCQQGQQSDHAATLTVPAALLTALYATTFVTPEVSIAPRPAADAASARAAASPPHAILHCCFRL